jgi:hypothetical protein
MKCWPMIVMSFAILVCAGSVEAVSGTQLAVEPLAQKEWRQLSSVTGFHSLIHRAAGLEVRVIEADASESVALDPVSLFVVATNRLTSTDFKGHIWRLPRTVLRVASVVVTACGVEIRAYVDRVSDENRVIGQDPIALKACFIESGRQLTSTLKLSEERPSVKRRDPPD